MKTYRELYFRGTVEQLKNFAKEIDNYVTGDWSKVKESQHWKDYLLFDYTGDKVNKARVSIYLADNILKGKIIVGNIVPLEKDKLNIDEYNDILVKFYNDVIKPYKNCGTELDISELSDDVFNPCSVISKEALKKLEIFCRAANKTTGSSHPCDRERWFDFICQTVDDGKMFDSSILANFLKDENYWGEKPDGFIGAMGNYAWDEEQAYELAKEYEILCEILQYYKKVNNI